MTEFESRVLADLSALKTQMESVVGGMQPGRLTMLEKRVELHEIYMQRTKGFTGACCVVFTLINLAIDLWRR